MSQIFHFGNVFGNGRSWTFLGNIRQYIWNMNGDFPEDSQDADLKTFWLDYKGGDFLFWLPGRTNGMHISLNIHLKICNEEGTVHFHEGWEVKHLSDDYPSVDLHSSFRSRNIADRSWDGFWITEVTITNVKRTVCDGMWVYSLLIPTDTEGKYTSIRPIITSTSDAVKSANDPQTKLFSDCTAFANHQLIQKICQVEGENYRLAHKLSQRDDEAKQTKFELMQNINSQSKLIEEKSKVEENLRVQLSKENAEVQRLGITLKQLEDLKAQLNVELDKLNSLLQVRKGSIDSLSQELEASEETIDKLTDQLKIKSDLSDKLQTDLKLKVDQLREEVEAAKSYRSEMEQVQKDLNTQQHLNDRNAEVINRQSTLIGELEEKRHPQLSRVLLPIVSFNPDYPDDVQSAQIQDELNSQNDSASEQVSFGQTNDDSCEPNPLECSEPPAKKRKMSLSATNEVGINTEFVLPVAVGIPSLPKGIVKAEITIEDDELVQEPQPNYPVCPGWTVPDFPDFNITTADQKSFPVNKVILCENCPYFKTLLYAGLSEATTGQVKSPRHSALMLELLKFIYKPSDFTRNEDVLVVELYEAANFYMLDGLKRICEVEMSKQLSFETLPYTADLADQIGSVWLLQKCGKFVVRRGVDQLFKHLQPIAHEIPNILVKLGPYMPAAKPKKTPIRRSGRNHE